jgi:hypothetical protein
MARRAVKFWMKWFGCSCLASGVVTMSHYVFGWPTYEPKPQALLASVLVALGLLLVERAGRRPHE